jgi:aspartate racemase
MHLIYKNLKAGKRPEIERFRHVQKELLEQGAQVIVLGCTELSLIKKDVQIGPGFLVIVEVLAQQSVLRCGKELREEYKSLITG